MAAAYTATDIHGSISCSILHGHSTCGYSRIHGYIIYGFSTHGSDSIGGHAAAFPATASTATQFMTTALSVTNSSQAGRVMRGSRRTAGERSRRRASRRTCTRAPARLLKCARAITGKRTGTRVHKAGRRRGTGGEGGSAV
jgi:hypothetical protein